MHQSPRNSSPGNTWLSSRVWKHAWARRAMRRMWRGDMSAGDMVALLTQSAGPLENEAYFIRELDDLLRPFERSSLTYAVWGSEFRDAVEWACSIAVTMTPVEDVPGTTAQPPTYSPAVAAALGARAGWNTAAVDCVLGSLP